MGNVIVDENILKNIADAIRQKGGTSQPIKVSEMPTAIKDLFLPDNFAYIGMVESTLNLARDTTWNSVTPNTTANTVIRPVTNNDYELRFAETVDLYEYDLLFIYAAEVNYAWKNESLLPKTMYHRNIAVRMYRKTERFKGFPLSIDNLEYISGARPTFDNTAMYYRNASGGMYASGTQYAPVISAPTTDVIYSSNSAEGSTEQTNANARYATRVLVNSPAINVKLHDSYFPLTTYRNVDAENTEIVRMLLVFKTPKQNTIWKKAYDWSYLGKSVEDLVK